MVTGRGLSEAVVSRVSDEDWSLVSKVKKMLPDDLFHFLTKMSDKTGITKIGSQSYHLEKLSREALAKLGEFLVDCTKITHSVILPSAGPEMTSFCSQVYMGILSGEEIDSFTPVCPDWSMDSSGQYDFRSLGDEASYIARKFFDESEDLFSQFNRRGIAYRPTLVFADWGMETEMTAKDTYGAVLPQEEVVRRFADCFQKTGALIEQAKNGRNGNLFKNVELISMTEFLVRRLGDPQRTYLEAREQLVSKPAAAKLLDEYSRVSLSVNQRRLGLSPEENYQTGAQTLSEYAVLGRAIAKGMMIAAESRTASRAYNILRGKHEKLPIIFLKGEKKYQGVNIL